MTKKDYIKFSKAIKSELEYWQDKRNGIGDSTAIENRISEVTAIIIIMADVFALDNPLFDRGRFYTACGISPE